jgi:2-polyprenyl-6-methoxyphenol hydroxylase-like FAD-dependent oxidoreductase
LTAAVPQPPRAGAQLETDVVVIGGGPTGRAAAHFLAQHGVGTVVLEQRGTPSGHPRATVINSRTMELLRHLGVDAEVRRAGVPLENTARITWCTELAGTELAGLDIIAYPSTSRPSARPAHAWPARSRTAGSASSSGPSSGTSP